MKSIKSITVLMAALFLSACTTMGETEYTLKPIETASGELVCCEATVFNTKNYDSLKFRFKKLEDGSIDVELNQSGVNASDPAKVQAENNSKLLDAVSRIIPIVEN